MSFFIVRGVPWHNNTTMLRLTMKEIIIAVSKKLFRCMSRWSAYLTGIIIKELYYEKDVIFCNVTGLDLCFGMCLYRFKMQGKEGKEEGQRKQ